MKGLTVRPAHEDDASTVAHLLCELLPQHTTADYAAVFARLLGGEHNDLVVAVADGDDTPCALLVMSYRWALHHRGLLGVIEELVVSAPVQGHGIGSRLVDHGLELARQRGVVDVEVVSALARERAHRFYERRGFARRSLVLTHPLGSGA